jgi:undecaprenyl-diphosphatase
MMLKLDRPAAARFSFLLSAPIVLAAELKELPGIADAASGDSHFQLAVLIGVSAAAISGYAAVSFLLRFLANHSLGWFAGWRVLAAAAFFIWYALS